MSRGLSMGGRCVVCALLTLIAACHATVSLEMLDKIYADELAALNSPLPDLLPAPASLVHWGNARDVVGSTVYTACEPGQELAEAKAGVLTSVDLERPDGLNVTWEGSTTPTQKQICSSHLFTSREDAVAAGCGLMAPPPLWSPPDETSSTETLHGFADLHVHLLSEYGFGGRWFYGSALGDIQTAMAPCDGSTNHGVGIFPAKFDVLSAVLSCSSEAPVVPSHTDQRNGWPGFEDWPRWNNFAHHQAHWSWVKKAHEAGLRLLIVSAVNNELVCEITAALGMPSRYGKGGCGDEENILLQLDKMHELAEQHKDWMEIATSPEDARRIIGAGSLAVVLHLEASDTLSHKPSGVSDTEWVKKQLGKYYERGVRSLQIVHEFNNELGGAATHLDLLISGNTFESVRDGISWMQAALQESPEAEDHLAQSGGAAVQSMLQQIKSVVPSSLFSFLEESTSPSPDSRKQPSPAAAKPSSHEALIPAQEALVQSDPATTTTNEEPQLDSEPGTLGDAGRAFGHAITNCPTHIWNLLGAMANMIRANERIETVRQEFKLAGNGMGGHYNDVGLTALGNETIRQAIAMGMVVDAAHLSQPAGRQALELMETAAPGYPYFISHAPVLEPFTEESSDFDLGAGSLHRIMRTNGMVGLRTVSSAHRTFRFTKAPNTCSGALPSYLQTWQMVELTGAPFAFSSDFNGVATNMCPRFGDVANETCSGLWRDLKCDQPLDPEALPQGYAGACKRAVELRDKQTIAQGDVSSEGTGTAFDKKGFASMEFYPQILQEMDKFHVSSDRVMTSADRFVRLWERAVSPQPPAAHAPAPSEKAILAAFRCAQWEKDN